MPDYNYPEFIFVNGAGGHDYDAYKDVRFQLQSAYQVGVICKTAEGEDLTNAKEAMDTALSNLVDFYTGIEEDETIEFTLAHKDQVQSCASLGSITDRLEVIESLIVQVNSKIG